MSELLANRYILASDLGHGGMADVYLAMDTVLNREVAIKILRGELTADPVSILRFQREANAASALSHPNIVEIYDVGEDNGRQFIVMEHVRGKTLKRLLVDRGALPYNEAVTIMKQLVSAVSAAHKANIIHRDIKSQNVLIKDDGTIKITDFGIALAQDAVQLTQTDSVMGSVHYMAPEIARGEIATVQSDIYSLGIVFYELLSGDVPYHGETPVQIAMKHMEEELPSLLAFDGTIPQSIDNIIHKACAKNKVYRYSSAEEMLKDIETCLDDNRKNEKKIDLSEVKNDSTIVISRINSKVDNKPENKKSSILSIGVGVSLIVLAFIAIVAIIILSSNGANKTMTMIDLYGYTVEEARLELEKNGLVLNNKINYKTTESDKVGTVIYTSPLANQEIEKGTSVTLTVCDANFIILEDYTGKNYDEVYEMFRNSRINVTSEKVVDSTKEAGTILSQSLASGTSCDPNRSYSLVLTVADYISFTVPDVIGDNVFEAMDELEALGAVVELESISSENLSEEEKESIKLNRVIEMSVDPYTYYIQKENSKIVLTYYYE